MLDEGEPSILYGRGSDGFGVFAGGLAELGEGGGVLLDGEAGGDGTADPFEIAETPEVDVADHDDGEEDEHVDEGGGAEFLEDGGPGVEEGDFDIEDEEDEGDDVEAEIELDPALAEGEFAAFVGGEFVGVGDAGAQEAADGEVEEDEEGAEGEEDGDGE